MDQADNRPLLYQHEDGPAPMVMNVQDPHVVDGPLVDALANLTHVVVRQQMKGCCCECCLGCEMENEYHIDDDHDNALLIAKEHSSFCFRQCCCNSRPFVISLKTPDGREAFCFDRPFKCGCRCCKSCRYTINCFTGANAATPKVFIGHAEYVWSCCVPVIVIFDESDNEVFRLHGKYCCDCCYGYTFFIYHEGHNVGKIYKKHFMNKRTHFEVKFPPHSTGRQRGLLIAATLLIDYLFFEALNPVKDED
ncbi:Phospholipid scramblase 2 [Pelomyxa schiedti]|nr:Phospholipid scramblase 2 [Pelomyxa schiedti]